MLEALRDSGDISAAVYLTSKQTFEALFAKYPEFKNEDPEEPVQIAWWELAYNDSKNDKHRVAGRFLTVSEMIEYIKNKEGGQDLFWRYPFDCHYDDWEPTVPPKNDFSENRIMAIPSRGWETLWKKYEGHLLGSNFDHWEALKKEARVRQKDKNIITHQIIGKPITKSSIYKILDNPVYIGKISHKGTIYEGEHVGFIDPDDFEKAKEIRETRVPNSSPLRCTQPTENTPLEIIIPIKFKKHGGRKYITTPDGRDLSVARRPKYENNMIKAIGRGHQYLEMLEAEPDLTIMKLAEREMLDHGYIAKTIRMTQLAPDIIEAILNGRQPYSLSLTDFMKPFPNGWEEQRQHFGFSQNA